MALIPKNFKYKKFFKGKIRTTNKNVKFSFGGYALKAGEHARLTVKQVESARKAVRKIIKPVGGIVRIKIKATVPVTEKAIATRMGRGKGKVVQNVCPVHKGSIILEIYCTNDELALAALRQAAFRLPLKVLVVKKIL